MYASTERKVAAGGKHPSLDLEQDGHPVAAMQQAGVRQGAGSLGQTSEEYDPTHSGVNLASHFRKTLDATLPVSDKPQIHLMQLTFSPMFCFARGYHLHHRFSRKIRQRKTRREHYPIFSS